MRRFARYGSCLLLVLLFTSEANARERKDPLEGTPAVRHRFELRDNRFVVGPSVNFSINRSLRHAILFGLKLEYHISDYLAIGADVGYGVGIDTGLAGELEDNYNNAQEWNEAADGFADIKVAGDVRLTFTPFAGKMAVFGKLFFAYDLFVFTGFGFALTQNNTDLAGSDEANEGFRPGFAWGFGIRMFFTKFFAMGVEIKDILFSDNESGKDITRGLTDTEIEANDVIIDGDDKSFANHFFVGLNFTFFFPTAPAISD